MHIWSILFLVIAINLDNLLIGIAYGIKKVRIPFTSNFVIALLSGIATFISIIMGKLILHIIPFKFGNYFGGGIVFAVGLWTIFSLSDNSCSIEPLKGVMSEPYTADIDNSGDISVKESLILGIALAVNCLVAGFGTGITSITGINIFEISIASITFSMITIGLGNYLGTHHFSYRLGDKCNIIAGILLCITGIYQMFV